MMAVQNQDQFEAYFKRADLDHDGRISGVEAVTFFQGSGLPKQVLAQIWTYADQNRAGFLGRQEFFNALKLVTVAQSKRDLTPEIVKAALYGAASSKIPPPQINLSPSPMTQSPSVATSPAMQMGAMTPAASQNLAYRGSVPPNSNMNQQYFPSQASQFIRPSQGFPAGSVPRPTQSAPGLPNSGFSSTGLPNSNMSVPGRTSSGLLTPGLPSSGMTTPGFPTPGLPSSGTMAIPGFPSSGMSMPGLPSSGMSTPGLPSSGMSTPGLPSTGLSIPGFPSSGMTTPGLPSSGTMTTPGLPSSGMSMPGLPSSGMSTPGLPSSGMSTPGLPNTGISTSGLPNSTISSDWLGGRMSGAPSGPTSQVPNRGAAPSLPSVSAKAQDLTLMAQSANKDSKAPSVSGNSFSSNSVAGGDPFAAFQTIIKPSASSATSSTTTTPVSSAIVPVSDSPTAASTPTSSAIVPISSAAQPPSGSRSLDSLQSAFAKQPVGGQPQLAQAYSGLSQPVPQVPSSGVSPGIPAGAGNSVSDQSQPPWPKMTTAGIQKYTKVFMEVDTDRDGKITGEQARNLFLSWRLPREVLKQVWDLADQDSDSMLSLREFCVALYLMERYREGRSLPASLPNTIMFDETLMRMTGLPNSSHGNASWGASSGMGFRPVQGVSASQGMAPGAGLRPAMQSTPQADGTMQFQQPKSSPLTMENSQPSQPSESEQNLLQPSPSEINNTEKKVEKVEKVVLDSREKLEFYRTKMQELVLYKSRCDNRLNEIIERASTDKREAEQLGKKYEEKYKQVAELASKLTIEEAKFREYQERKMELQQAIINMEQGGSADGILQVRADRIQSDLEELLKALSECCKKLGLEIKSAAVIELPKGWQPGIQEGAAVWDEEWDKFEDDGLVFDKEINADTQNTKASPKSTLFENGSYPHDDAFSPDSSSYGDGKSEKQFSRGERVLDSESGYAHSEDHSVRSPHGSPSHRATPESPSQDFSDVFAKSSEADTDFHRSFDDQGWGTFDGNDDVDSVWGFNSKDLGHEQHGEDRLFESSGFGLSPRTESVQGDSTYNQRSLFNFADSVPGTPFSKSGNSPRYSEAGDGFFDNYSRFDSFSMSESNRFSPPRETLARFDSISSSKGGFGHSRGFTSFDDADPFGSSGPFKVSSETPKKGSDNWSSF